MRHRARSVGLGLPVTLLFFGLWAVFVGLLVVYVSMNLIAVAGHSGGAVEGAGVTATLLEPLTVLYEGGVVTLGVGGALMLVGGVAIAARPTSSRV